MGGTGASSTALTSCHVAVAPGTWARRGADREAVGECNAWVESSGLPFGDPRLPRTLSPSPAPQVPSCPAAGPLKPSWRGLCRLRTRVNQLSSALTWHINHLPREEHPIAQRWVKTQRPRSRACHLGRGAGQTPGGSHLGQRPAALLADAMAVGDSRPGTEQPRGEPEWPAAVLDGSHPSGGRSPRGSSSGAARGWAALPLLYLPPTWRSGEGCQEI